MVVATFSLALLPTFFQLKGYILALVLLTPGYQLFLAANNTRVMVDAEQEKRGVVSGILNLSRNLGLITGASVMGAVFALAIGHQEVAMAQPVSVANAMKVTYLLAGALVFVSFIFAVVNNLLHRKNTVEETTSPP